MGPGIYGAESARRYYDETAARNIGLQQAARLAAILPAPLRRRPERMNNYRVPSLSGCAKWVGNGILTFAPVYLMGREPVMRMSTSLLALCCQSGPDAT